MDLRCHQDIGILIANKPSGYLERSNVPIVVVHYPKALHAMARQTPHDVKKCVSERQWAKRYASIETYVVERHAVGKEWKKQ